MHSNGLVASMVVDGPVSGSTDAVTYYYTSTGLLSSISKAYSNTTTYSQFTGNGLPQRIDYPNAYYEQYEYDGRGRTTKFTNNDGPINYAYTARGELQSISGPYSRTMNYDSVGRLTSVSDPLDNATIDYQYDLLGNVTSIKKQRSGAVYYEHSFDYDEVGNLVLSEGSNGQQTDYTYDINDRLETATDALGRVTRYGYNSLGQVKSETNPAGDTALMTYESTGNVASVTDYRGLKTSYFYDGFGNLVQVSSPDGGGGSITYNADGTMATDSRGGQTLSYTYDAVGRLSNEYNSSAGFSRRFTYEDCTNGKGRLCRAYSPYDSSTEINYEYDSSGNVTRQGYVIGLSSYEIRFNYGSYGRLHQIIYPGDLLVEYGYDSSGRANSVDVIIQRALEKSLVSQVSYYPFGPAKQMNLLGAFRNTTYDKDYRLSSIRDGASTVNADGQQYRIYGYDAANRMTSIRDQLSATDRTLGYDAMSHLKSDTSSAGSYSWNYDANGNRKSESINGVSKGYAISSTSNKVLSQSGQQPETYIYGSVARGVVSSISGRDLSMSHDSAYQMKAATASVNVDAVIVGDAETPAFNTPLVLGAEYEYDNFGRRTRKLIDNLVDSHFLHSSGGDLLMEVDALRDSAVEYVDDVGDRLGFSLPTSTLSAEDLQLSVPTTAYIWFNGEIVGLYRAGQLLAVHNDHLGRPEYVSDELNLTPLWKATNRAYDRAVDIDLIGGLNIGFPGQYYDVETGLYNNWHRYYDPTSGRYLQTDPIGLVGGFNTYAYALANPVAYIDFTGEEPVKGERGQTAKPDGTADPFKHMKQHPTDPDKVIFKDPHTGKKIVKPKPAGFPGKAPGLAPALIPGLLEMMCQENPSIEFCSLLFPSDDEDC